MFQNTFVCLHVRHTCRKDQDLRISAPPILKFDVAQSHIDAAWGHFDVDWRKLWLKNDVFDEILGCAGHLTSPEKKWAPVAIKIFYKYAPKALLEILAKIFIKISHNWPKDWSYNYGVTVYKYKCVPNFNINNSLIVMS